MGHKKMSGTPGALFHLILPGRRKDAVVQNVDEWRMLDGVVARALWWCGGVVHGFRCEGSDLHFALEIARTPVWAMAHRISAGYGQQLSRLRGWRGGVFGRYVAIPLDATLHLVYLVIWLHRSEPAASPAGATGRQVWTGEPAYVSVGAIPWVTTERVLSQFGRGAAAVQAYGERKARGVGPGIVAMLNRRCVESLDDEPHGLITPVAETADDLMVERIARAVARHQNIPYAGLYSKSRRREFAKAKAIAAVLAVRRGVSLAAVAEFFGKDPSTLTEEAARYRERQPCLFEGAEAALAHLLDSDDREAMASRPAPLQMNATGGANSQRRKGRQ
ncbi:MAG: helix-turn-helix domain-containing protein [Steroidobacteraceae bacterium]